MKKISYHTSHQLLCYWYHKRRVLEKLCFDNVLMKISNRANRNSRMEHGEYNRLLGLPKQEKKLLLHARREEISEIGLIKI